MPEPRFSLSQIDREMLISDLDFFDDDCQEPEGWEEDYEI